MMILRGKKLQEALLLVAEGRLSDFQIAERLQDSARILEATRGLPIFETRVAQIILKSESCRSGKRRSRSPNHTIRFVKVGDTHGEGLVPRI